MQRLLLIALLAAAACGGKSPATTPRNSSSAVVDAPLGKATLVAFVQQRFPAAVVAGTFKLDFGSDGMETTLVKELGILGITTTGQLAAIVPPDYDTKGVGAIARSDSPTTNVTGLIRDLMIIHDLHGYFTKAWDDSWSADGPEEFPAPAAYGVNFDEMRELGVFGGEADGHDPCASEEPWVDTHDFDPCGGDPCGGDPCGD